MILFPYAELIASLFILLFSFHIYSRCHENKVARFFSRLALLTFFACILEYSVRIAFTLDLAAALNHISGALWALIFPTYAHFCLIFSRKDRIIKKPFSLFIFYLPGYIVAALFMFTNLMFIRHDINPFGIAGQPSPFYWMFVITTITYSIWGIILLIEHAFSSPQKSIKAQAILIAASSIIVFSIAGVSDEILPLIQGFRIFPPTAILGAAVMNFCIYLAMRNYALFSISPACAAEVILETMPNSLIVTNLDGQIILINDEAHRLFNVPKEKIVGKQFSSMFADKEKYEKLYYEVEVKNLEIERFPAEIIDPLGEKFSALINANKIRDALGSTLGLVYIIRDIRG